MAFTRFVVLCSFLVHAGAWGWSAHYLVTDRAFTRKEYTQKMNETVPVEPLRAFLADGKNGIKPLFDSFYQWLKARHAKRFKVVRWNSQRPVEAAFLAAARLNPQTTFPYVRRLFPGKGPTGTSSMAILLESFSPFEVIDKRMFRQFEAKSDGTMTVREVIDTFSDEPDWQIDHALWSHPEYGYGKIPYGPVNDPSSGAAFHMQFSNENFIVRRLVPGLAEGMTAERVELFLRLARAAFHSNHPYWGNRFCAWSLHYLEDITQPYHSKAVPNADFKFYVKFALAPDKAQYTRDATQLVSNRHHLYEDFVAALLEKSFVADDKVALRLVESLENGHRWDDDLLGAAETTHLFKRTAQEAAEKASSADAAVVMAFGPKLTQDPTYDLDSDKGYDSHAVFQSLDPSHSENLVKEAVSDLSLTGRAARTLFEMCHG